MTQINVTEPRLSWRIHQLAKATGLSLPFLRKAARDGDLKVRKVKGAVIVLDEDARAFLAGERVTGQKNAEATASAVAQ